MGSDPLIPENNCTKCFYYISFAQLYDDDLNDIDYGICKKNAENIRTVSKYRTCSDFDPE